jgi:hypothetical protein
LELLESMTDRQTCLALIQSHFGELSFFNAPQDPQTYMAFRKAINDMIKERM